MPADAFERVKADFLKWKKSSTYEHWYAETLDSQDNKCYYCGTPLTFRTNVDHTIPIYKGGTNDTSNLVIACWACNKEKGNDIWEDWRVPNIRANKDHSVAVEYLKGYDTINLQITYSDGESHAAKMSEAEARETIDLLSWVVEKLKD